MESFDNPDDDPLELDFEGFPSNGNYPVDGLAPPYMDGPEKDGIEYEAYDDWGRAELPQTHPVPDPSEQGYPDAPDAADLFSMGILPDTFPDEAQLRPADDRLLQGLIGLAAKTVLLAPGLTPFRFERFSDGMIGANLSSGSEYVNYQHYIEGDHIEHRVVLGADHTFDMADLSALSDAMHEDIRFFAIEPRAETVGSPEEVLQACKRDPQYAPVRRQLERYFVSHPDLETVQQWITVVYYPGRPVLPGEKPFTIVVRDPEHMSLRTYEAQEWLGRLMIFEAVLRRGQETGW